jgi:hypothetical protein
VPINTTEDEMLHSKIRVTAIAALALALATPTLAAQLGPDEAANPAFNGKRHLGVDISDVQLNYPAVQNFLQSLTPVGQRGVITACQNQDSWGAATRNDARSAVSPFCQMITPTIAAGAGG